MSALRTLSLALALAGSAAAAFAQATPVGLWRQIDDDGRTERSQVRIVEAGGVLSGRIVKISDAAKADVTCTACTGEAKDKPLLNLQILSGVRQNESDKTVWDGGEILDPNNGKSYRVQLMPEDGGRKLQVRGYIGTPLLGRSQTWLRAE